jgi:hypothetical protein
VAVFAVVGVFALAVAGVFVVKAVALSMYHGVTSTLTPNPADIRAAQLADGLQEQLRVISWSPGHITGSLHTEGGFVKMTEGLGGVVLSFSTSGAGQPGGAVHVADFILLPSGARPGDGIGYEAPSPAVTRPGCYEVRFGDYPPTVGQPTRIPCPVARPDGGPGSVQEWLAALPAAQPQSRYAAPPNTYPLTAAGVRAYLTSNFVLASEPVVSTASGGGVLAAAFRYHGACFYVRMAPTSSASARAAGAMWLAPADAQGSGCDGSAARAASALYGVDGAQEG